MQAAFTTIGHSNRSLDEFTKMLQSAQVRLVVDVRAFPRSRSNPAFNIDILPEMLAQVQIGYRHCPALGGRRAKQQGVDPNLNALWRVQSFHNYADYALSDDFSIALEAVIQLAHERRVTLMCAEALWWRCHRRIITDYLLLRGHAVDHLMAPDQTHPASPTPGAQRYLVGRVIYPATSHPAKTKGNGSV